MPLKSKHVQEQHRLFWQKFGNNIFIKTKTNESFKNSRNFDSEAKQAGLFLNLAISKQNVIIAKLYTYTTEAK